MEDATDLLVLTLCLLVAVDALQLFEKEDSLLLKAHIEEQRRLFWSLPADKKRVTWTAFSERISDTHFRRQFRMSRTLFTNLCNILSSAIGENSFRSEHGSYSTLNAASLQRRGGLIPGELKVAVSLHILAGGSYLDLAPLFDLSPAHIYSIFDQFIQWVMMAFDFP